MIESAVRSGKFYHIWSYVERTAGSGVGNFSSLFSEVLAIARKRSWACTQVRRIIDEITRANDIAMYYFVVYVCWHTRSGLGDADFLASLRYRAYSLAPIDLYGLSVAIEVAHGVDCNHQLFGVLRRLDKMILCQSAPYAKKPSTSLYSGLARELRSLLDGNRFDLPGWFWTKMADFFVMFADFRMYLYCRERYKLTVRAQEKPVLALLQLESGEEPVRRTAGGMFVAHRLLMTGERRRASVEMADRIFRQQGAAEFRELVQGKNVAIVGPAPTALDHGAEIDGFDLVYRLNLAPKEPDESFGLKYGYRSDVVFLNGAMSKRLKAGSVDLSHMRYAVSKYDVRGERVRKVVRNNFMLMGAPNGLQYALYDLLWFMPARIKIFACTLYASASAYSTEYARHVAALTNVEELSWNYGLGFLDHDLISNLSFVRRCMELGYIDADDESHEVIRMSDECYLERLEECYPALYA